MKPLNVTTYSHARANFASLCDQVTSSREAVLIRRRRAEDVALVSADELSSLVETAHLLRSPENARRLLNAIERAEAGTTAPSSLEQLRVDLGLSAPEGSGADPAKTAIGE